MSHTIFVDRQRSYVTIGIAIASLLLNLQGVWLGKQVSILWLFLREISASRPWRHRITVVSYGFLTASISSLRILTPQSVTFICRVATRIIQTWIKVIQNSYILRDGINAKMVTSERKLEQLKESDKMKRTAARMNAENGRHRKRTESETCFCLLLCLFF